MSSGVDELMFQAAQGSLDAQLDLARYFSNRNSDNFDFDKAEKWLRRAITKGSTYAKY